MTIDLNVVFTGAWRLGCDVMLDGLQLHLTSLPRADDVLIVHLPSLFLARFAFFAHKFLSAGQNTD